MNPDVCTDDRRSACPCAFFHGGRKVEKNVLSQKFGRVIREWKNIKRQYFIFCNDLILKMF